MRPTLTDHHIAISEALNSAAVKDLIAIREAIPHMYLLNICCDCVSVTTKLFSFRIALDYGLIKNNEIPAHEEVVVTVDVMRKGGTPEVTVKL